MFSGSDVPPFSSGSGAAHEPLSDDDGVDFSVEVTRLDDTIQIAIIGELDLGTGPLLVDAVERHGTHGGAAVVVDLGGLTFIDVAGTRAMIRATSIEAPDHRTRLINTPSTARRLFAIAGLADRFDIE